MRSKATMDIHSRIAIAYLSCGRKLWHQRRLRSQQKYRRRLRRAWKVNKLQRTAAAAAAVIHHHISRAAREPRQSCQPLERRRSSRHSIQPIPRHLRKEESFLMAGFCTLFNRQKIFVCFRRFKDVATFTTIDADNRQVEKSTEAKTAICNVWGQKLKTTRVLE